MARQDKPPVWIRARVVYMTDKAIQILPANQDKKFWLPKSQVLNIGGIESLVREMDQDSFEKMYLDIEAKEWIVTKNEIPTYDCTGKELDEEIEEDWDDDSPF